MAASHQIRVLVVDDSRTTREVLKLLISAQPDMQWVGSAVNGREGLLRAAELRPDIVLMDIHMPDMDGIQATWLVANAAALGAVIMVSSEERVDFLQKAMSAGAQGYVLKPLSDGAQLLQTIRNVHQRSSSRQMQVVDNTPMGASLVPHVGKRIVVLGPKAGVGTTTIAISLGLLLCKRKQTSVALLDADFLTGDATIHLDLKPERTILDLMPHIDALDAGLLSQVLVKYQGGLQVLAPPAKPEQAEGLTADAVRTVASSLAQMFDVLIIDAAITYDDRMLAVLDMADLYVVVVTPHLGILRALQYFLNVAGTLGYPEDRMLFVLNRASQLGGLSFEDIELFAGKRQFTRVPTGGLEVTQSLNEGKPLVLHQGPTAIARAMQDIASQVQARIAQLAVRG